MAAAKRDAGAMLAASCPAKGSLAPAGTDSIVLTFAEPAEVISVAVRLPDETEISAEPEVPEAPVQRHRRRQRQVRYRLPVPLQQPGSYSISYLLTSNSFKSLNGFVDFEIAAEAGAEASRGCE